MKSRRVAASLQAYALLGFPDLHCPIAPTTLFVPQSPATFVCKKLRQPDEAWSVTPFDDEINEDAPRTCGPFFWAKRKGQTADKAGQQQIGKPTRGFSQGLRWILKGKNHAIYKELRNHRRLPRSPGRFLVRSRRSSRCRDCLVSTQDPRQLVGQDPASHRPGKAEMSPIGSGTQRHCPNAVSGKSLKTTV